MKFLITGASGFIGSNLCRYLLNQNHKVLAIDNFYTSSISNIENLGNNPNFEFIQHNIIDDFPEEAINFKAEIIINLACPASPKYYQKDPVFTWETSLIGTRNCLRLAKKNDSLLMHASTSEVYGDPKENPQKETYWGNVNPIGIRSCYDESKRAAETFLMDSYRQGQGNVKIFRIFNTYGPYMAQDDGRVVSNFIMQALNNKDLTIYGNGEQTRSFQYIDDLIKGIMALSISKSSFIGPVNLGNPNEITIKELATKVLELVPEISKKPCTSILSFQNLPDDDPNQRCPDINLAKKELGWEPKIELDQGLRKTIQAFL